MQNEIVERYFEFLIGLVCDEYHSRYFRNLLEKLHRTEFTVTPRFNIDLNRATDGIDMRPMFAEECGYFYPSIRETIGGPCSLLEMMVGLAYRMEFGIMGDDTYGDRTAKWFWVMIRSMGLLQMDDGRYDEEFVDDILAKVLARHYEPDGKGGFFWVRGFEGDMRKIEIWYQMCAYLNNIDSVDLND